MPTYLHDCFFGGMTTIGRSENMNAFVLTKLSFKKFQEELARASQYKVHDKTNMVYMVDYYKDPHLHKGTKSFGMMIWLVIVACKHFEFRGIFCCHILTIFIHINSFEIPTRYLPLRWSLGEFHFVDTIPVHSEEQTIVRSRPSNASTSIVVDEFVRCPPISTTKEHPDQSKVKAEKS
ncbi:hypothetical protein Cgig2_032247 [Carnegiea gigantea]|uniref:Protein FAR1-RELATED SEQUENCE n=1 Tax=Carnegiea gigantea TaxID=171969 RepID=A0A9Q1Q7X6_9CARY|nr:hypothetical protein Cgig2_032247 [Carnegiea gigantea]